MDGGRRKHHPLPPVLPLTRAEVSSEPTTGLARTVWPRCWAKPGAAGRAGGRDRRVLGEGGVLEFGAAAAHADSALQQLVERRGKAGVAAVDCVLRVTQQMGQAKLPFMCMPGLCRVAIGDPNFGVQRRLFDSSKVNSPRHLPSLLPARITALRCFFSTRLRCSQWPMSG